MAGPNYPVITQSEVRSVLTCNHSHQCHRVLEHNLKRFKLTGGKLWAKLDLLLRANAKLHGEKIGRNGILHKQHEIRDWKQPWVRRWTPCLHHWCSKLMESVYLISKIYQQSWTFAYNFMQSLIIISDTCTKDNKLSCEKSFKMRVGWAAFRTSSLFLVVCPAPAETFTSMSLHSG